MLKKLKKGFTLVEVIVATAITGLLIAAVMALFGPVKGIIGGIEEDVVTNNVTDVIGEYLITRIEKCTTYNIDLYNFYDNVLGQTETDPGSLQERVAAVKGMCDNSLGEKTYCLVLRNEGGCFRLYDFGEVDNGLQLGLDIYTCFQTGGITNCVFFPEYYNDMQYRFTFKTTPVGAVNPEKKWCEIGITAFNPDGTVAVESRPQTFKLLNMDLSSPAESNSILESLDNVDYDQTSPLSMIAILYNTKDYTVI